MHVFDVVQQQLTHLGYRGRLSDLHLYSGPQRESLLGWLIQRLCQGGRDTVECRETPTWSFNSIHKELQALGLGCTEAQVQGTGTGQERLQFLHELLQLVVAATSCSGPEDLVPDLAMLSWACENFERVTEESVSLFTPDMMADITQYSGRSRDVLDHLPAVEAARDQYQQQLKEIQLKISPGPWDQWDEHFHHQQRLLRDFLEAAEEMDGMYMKELHAWSNDRQGSSFLGLGPLASSIMSHYEKLSQVATSISTICSCHHDISTATGSCKGLNHLWLQKLVAEAQRQIKDMRCQQALLQQCDHKGSGEEAMQPH